MFFFLTLLFPRTSVCRAHVKRSITMIITPSNQRWVKDVFRNGECKSFHRKTKNWTNYIKDDASFLYLLFFTFTHLVKAFLFPFPFSFQGNPRSNKVIKVIKLFHFCLATENNTWCFWIRAQQVYWVKRDVKLKSSKQFTTSNII